jgi:hypothetical protein
MDVELVPACIMRFCRFGYARNDVCFCSPAPHLHHSEAERGYILSLERSRLPCGPDFPQTLLTCRRPVSPRPGAVVPGATKPVLFLGSAMTALPQ